MNDSNERWVPIPGCPGYEVSDLGRVRSIDRMVTNTLGQTRTLRGRVLATPPVCKGYPMVTLGKAGNRLVHQLVLEAFVGPRPPGIPVCHNDGDRTNNHLNNLRYDSPSENMYDVVRHGRHAMANKTECPKGHLYSPENTLVSNGRRYCRTCARAWTALSNARRPSRAKRPA